MKPAGPPGASLSVLLVPEMCCNIQSSAQSDP